MGSVGLGPPSKCDSSIQICGHDCTLGNVHTAGFPDAPNDARSVSDPLLLRPLAPFPPVAGETSSSLACSCCSRLDICSSASSHESPRTARACHRTKKRHLQESCSGGGSSHQERVHTFKPLSTRGTKSTHAEPELIGFSLTFADSRSASSRRT